MTFSFTAAATLAVVPVLVNPLLVLLVLLPGLLLAFAGAILSLFRPAGMKTALKLIWRLKIQVALAAALAIGIWYGASWALAGSSGAVSEQEASRRGWPLFRGSLARRGAAPGERGPTAGGVNWSSVSVEKSFLSSPAVVGNRVYATSAVLGVFHEEGAIYCFDAETGGVAWKYVPAGYRATFSSPAVSGETLVVGEGLHFTRDARVICLDIGGEKGELLWEYRTKSHVESSPAIADGRVYIGAGDDGYYCFELAPAAPGKPTVVWHVSGEEYADAESSPAVFQGRVYVGLGVGGQAICCLDAETGAEIWRIKTPYPVFGPPTIARGRLFVGMGNGNFAQTAEQVRSKELAKLREQGAGKAELKQATEHLGPGGEVWCVDLETHQVRWRFKTGRVVLGAVAAGKDDQIWFADRNGVVYSLSYDGKEIGRWNAHESIVASPALTDEHVYVVTEKTGRLYALDRKTFKPVWEMALSGNEGMYISSPAVARGHVYVGTQKDGLLCLGQPTDKQAEPLWAAALGGPGAGGALDHSPLPARGSFAWNYPEDQDEDTPEPVRITAPAACIGSNLLVPLAGGPRQGLLCLPVDTTARGTPQETQQETPQARWFVQAPNGVRLSPAIAGSDAFFVDGSRGELNRRLHCVDIATGRERWAAAVSPDASGEFIAASGDVFIQDQPGVLSRLDLAGHKTWTWPVGELRGHPAVHGPMLIAAVAAKPALLAMDRETGITLWDVPLAAAPLTAPAVRGDRVYVGTSQGLEARSLVDGAPVQNWQITGGAVAGGAFALTREFIAYVNVAGELVLVDTQSGEVLGRHAGALPGVAPLVSRGAVLYAARDGLMQLSGHEPKTSPRLWLDTSWLGKPTSPMILADSRVYLGIGVWGFVCAGKSK